MSCSDSLPHIGTLFDGVFQTGDTVLPELFTGPARCLSALADIATLLLQRRAQRRAPSAVPAGQLSSLLLDPFCDASRLPRAGGLAARPASLERLRTDRSAACRPILAVSQ